MADQEWLEAREALHMLGIGEAELQTLVASGSLRAFRAAGTMKFRREDIAALKVADNTPTIIPPSVPRAVDSGILPTIPDLELTHVDSSTSGAITSVSQSSVHAGLPLSEPPKSGVAVARVRAAPSSRVNISMASSRRTRPAYRFRPAHPLMTALLLLNSAVLLFSGSLGFIMLNVGYYDRVFEQRIIPAYINHTSSTPVYRWCYHNTPGNPQDVKPLGEYDGGETR